MLDGVEVAMTVEISYFDAAPTDACTLGTDGTEVICCTILSIVGMDGM